MLAAKRPPKKEYYAAILNDRSSGGPALVTSRQGGMNIEDVAKEDPSAILTTPIGTRFCCCVETESKFPSIDFEKGLSQSE